MADKQSYQDWIEKFKPEAFADFDTAELPCPVKSPSNLQEAVELIKDAQIVSTGFINEMSEKGFLINVGDKKSTTEEHVSDYHFQCSCCKKIQPRLCQSHLARKGNHCFEYNSDSQLQDVAFFGRKHKKRAPSLTLQERNL